MIISIENQKGGVGKTTIAIHVAQALAMEDSSVLLVDADPQGSARDWAAARESPPDFSVVGLDRPTLHRDLPAIAANCRIEIKTSDRKLKWVNTEISDQPKAGTA